jgi:hypothetical protein
MGDEDKKAGEGVSVGLDVFGVKANAAVSDTTLARYFAGVEGDALKKLRDGAIKDSERRIRKAIKKGELGALEEFDRMIFGAAFGEMLHREVGRLQNRVETQALIEEELAAQPDVKALPPATPEEEAFTERFWDEVGDVSEVEVQRLYAQAAVRAIKQPNSISVNTLAVLRRLDSKTVLAFEAVSRFLCNKRIIVMPASDTPELTTAFGKLGIDGYAINHLISVGLFTNRGPWAVETYADGTLTYALWRFAAKAVRLPVSLLSGVIPVGVKGSLTTMYVDGMFLSSAAAEIMSAIRPIPAPDEVAIGRTIARTFSGIRASVIGPPEETYDEGKTWQPHEGVWPL